MVEGIRSFGVGGESLSENAVSLCQTVDNLVVGQTYQLSFYQGAHASIITQDLYWNVKFGDETYRSDIMSAVANQGCYPNDPTGAHKNWNISDTPQLMTFTATSTSQELCFLNSPPGRPRPPSLGRNLPHTDHRS